MSKVVRIYVYPQFKKILKQEAISEGKTVTEWTKELTERDDPLVELANRIKKRSKVKGFDFV